MSDFEIPKNRHTVTAHFTDGSKLKGDVFLLSYTTYHSGPQKVAELLEDGNKFIPFLVSESNKVELINKELLKMVEGEVVEAADEEMLSIGLIHIEEITVFFHDNTNISGAFLAEVPPDHSRLSDCLNLPERFMNLKADSRHIHINKGMIKKVVSTKK